MCTVTYWPYKDGTFCLTQNRDEAPSRSAFEISKKQIGAHLVLYPKDAGAQGTWIAASDQGRLVCLLNGAFEKHKHMPPYRMSRGLILLDQFNYSDVSIFAHLIDLKGIEPFTMIMMEHGLVTEMIWDGARKFVKSEKGTRGRIWASATLYPESWRLAREQWLTNWSREGDHSADSIMHFHQNAGIGDPKNDLVMNRQNKVRTVSITQITHLGTSVNLHFQDLLEGEMLQEELALATGVPMRV